MSAPDAKPKTGFFWKLYPVGIFVGVALFVVGAGYQDHKAGLTKTWPTTTGTIVESSPEYIPGGASAEYSPHVIYGYSVGSGRYIGHRVYLYDGVYSRGEVEGFLTQYPAGKTVEVYYSAADPSQSVLRPGSPSLEWGSGFKSLLFELLVLGGIFAIYQTVRIFRA